MRLGRGPADEPAFDLSRQHLLEVGAHVLRTHEHDVRALEPSEAGVERVRDPAPVPFDDLVDVALVARLRPAALVVSPGHVLGLVCDLEEPPAAQAEHLAALAADRCDEDPVAAPDEPGERRKVELARDLHVVLHRLGKRQRAPEVVEPCREDADPPGAVAIEPVVEPGRDPIDVRLQSLPLRAWQLALSLVQLALRRGENRVNPRLHRPGRGRVARIEVDVEAHRAPVLGAKACQLTKLVPAERPCHDVPSLPGADDSSPSHKECQRASDRSHL